MSTSTYLALLHEPVPVLDSRSRRRSSTQELEFRAARAATIVAARVLCECQSTQDDRQTAKDKADDRRVNGIIGAFTGYLDAQHRKVQVEQTRLDRADDRRVKEIVCAFIGYLDREHRAKCKVEQKVDRARKHQEYLDRCAVRARARYERAWRASRARSAQPDQRVDDRMKPEYLAKPGPLVKVGPATKVTQCGALTEPKPATLTYRMTNKLCRAMAAFEAAMPEPEQILTAHDYTSPVRDGVQLNSMEEHKMDYYDRLSYDDSHLAEIDAAEFGRGAINQPTHATMAAARFCTCESEPGAHYSWDDGAILKPNVKVVILEGAEVGSLSGFSQGTHVDPCKVEVRF